MSSMNSASREQQHTGQYAPLIPHRHAGCNKNLGGRNWVCDRISWGCPPAARGMSLRGPANSRNPAGHKLGRACRHGMPVHPGARRDRRAQTPPPFRRNRLGDDMGPETSDKCGRPPAARDMTASAQALSLSGRCSRRARLWRWGRAALRVPESGTCGAYEQ
jgi:hypothetical protein